MGWRIEVRHLPPLINGAIIWKSVQAEEETKRVRVTETPGLRERLVEEMAADLPALPFSLVTMMDGWMARGRGAQWGLKPKDAPGERVVWREIKTALIFRLSDRAETKLRRGVLLEKFYVAHQGDPHELGRKLHADGCNSLLRKSPAAKRRGMRKGTLLVFLAFLAAVIHGSRFAGIISKTELRPAPTGSPKSYT
jgi:hypothetical protein